MTTVLNATEQFEVNLAKFVADEAKRLGLTVTVDQSRRSSASTIVTIQEDLKEEWVAYARHFGYPVDWLNKKFISQGHLYTIVGVRPNADRRNGNCLRIKRADGREFVCKINMVKTAKFA